MECGIVGDMCKDRVRNQFINLNAIIKSEKKKCKKKA